MLPSLLARFVTKQGPGTDSAWRSKVLIGNTAAICDAVAAFELDVGLIEGPCHQETLAVTPWLQDEMVVVASPGERLALSAKTENRVSLRMLRERVWLGAGTGLRHAGSDRSGAATAPAFLSPQHRARQFRSHQARSG